VPEEERYGRADRGEVAVRRARVAAGGVVAAGALVAGGVLLASGGPAAPAAAAPVGATAAVEQRDLVDRESIGGTLGYDDQGVVDAAGAGVLTRLPDPGAVITRGHSLYDLADKPAAFLLYGSLPAWRRFAPGMSDGADVRQLERNLRALGYDAGTVDEDWDADTTAAVEDFQADRGLDRTGTFELGHIVFRSGATRIAEAKAAVGDAMSPGRPLASVSSTRRVITVKLDARRQRIAHVGDRVTVDMPEGGTSRGRIGDVGAVATAAKDADPTIDVTVELRGKGARGTRLDQAPVDVSFAVERRRGVLAVLVKALVARQGEGYAVETANGRFIAVEPGMYADDWVEVSGSGLREGMRVVTAQ
jgi:peptidoglycan hydrolase-like protein with peptidoglycan-binding domain